jgi:hypothetical protein
MVLQISVTQRAGDTRKGTAGDTYETGGAGHRFAVEVRRATELFRGRTDRQLCECGALRPRDAISDLFMRSSRAWSLLTAVLCVQLGTSCPTFRTISDREQATK